MNAISPRKITIYLPDGPKEYEEGKNCDRIQDQEGPTTCVKIITGERMQIFRGAPYSLDVNRSHDLGTRSFSRPQQNDIQRGDGEHRV